MRDNRVFKCPKCGMYYMCWDEYTKTLRCYGVACQHIITDTGIIETIMNRVEQQDYSEWDGTDFAHPAFWRGAKHSLCFMHKMISDIVAGRDKGLGIMPEKPEEIRQMILSLKRERDDLRCQVARLEQEATESQIKFKGVENG